MSYLTECDNKLKTLITKIATHFVRFLTGLTLIFDQFDYMQ